MSGFYKGHGNRRPERKDGSAMFVLPLREVQPRERNLEALVPDNPHSIES